MSNRIEDLMLSDEDSAAVNALLATAARERRFGALTFFAESRCIAWCGLLYDGVLTAQMLMPAASAATGEAVARCLADALVTSIRAKNAQTEADAALRKIMS